MSEVEEGMDSCSCPTSSSNHGATQSDVTDKTAPEFRSDSADRHGHWRVSAGSAPINKPLGQCTANYLEMLLQVLNCPWADGWGWGGGVIPLFQVKKKKKPPSTLDAGGWYYFLIQRSIIPGAKPVWQPPSAIKLSFASGLPVQKHETKGPQDHRSTGHEPRTLNLYLYYVHIWMCE